MKLYKKTLLITIVTLICLIMLLYITSFAILMNSFTRVEEQDTQKNVQRATMALSDDISALDRVVGDWAAWDETYAFIQDGDLSYMERNAPNATFIELNVDLMLFINSSGGIVYARGFNSHTGEELPVPASLKALPADNILLKHNDKYGDVKGIILLPEGPTIVASRPILDNERKEPIRGSMIWGRYLRSAEIQQLANVTHLAITVYRFDDMQKPPDFEATRNSFSKFEPIVVRALDEQTIGGYTLLNDIYGNPALMLRVDIPRAIYYQGKMSIQYLLISLIAIGLVFGVVTLLLLDKFVLSRLAYLSADVSTIGSSGNLSKRISMTGKDELSELAGEINRMLEGLEQSEQKLRISESALSEAQRIACLGNWDWDIVNNNLKWSDEIYRIFGLKPQELVVTYEAFLNSVHPDDRELVEKYVNDALYQKKPYGIDHRIVLPDGSVRTVHEQAALTLDENDKPIRMVGTVQDITDRKQAQEALRRAHDELEIRVQERTAELAGANRALQAEIDERKRAEEAAQESEKKFRQIMETAQEGIWAIDAEKRTTFVNQRMAEMLGYTVNEMMITSLFDFIDEENRNIAASNLEREQQGIPGHFEFKFKRKDGSALWGFLNTNPLFDNEGQYAGALAMISDITRRKQMEEALTKSEAKYRALFEEAGDYILVISLREFNRPVIVDANGAALQHHGYSREEMIGKAVWELEAPGCYEKNQEIASQLQKPGDSCIFETIHMRKDGITFPVEVSLRMYQIGDEPPFIISIERDITERKKAEEALRESEEKYKALIETTDTGYLILDSRGKVVDANREYVRLSGYTSLNEIIGRSVIEWTAEYDRERNASEVAKCLEQGYIRDLRIDYVDRRGRKTPVEIQANIVKTGQSFQIVSLCRDITERMRAEEKLKETLKELTRSNAELEQFAHMSAHDLQEPLRMVALYVQMIDKRYSGKLDADADEFIAYAVEGAQRMSRMINDLLVYSSLDKHVNPLAPTDCGAVLEWAISNLKEVIMESKAEITHDPMPSGIPVDGSQFVRLFQNLIDNAIKFRSEASPIIHVSAKNNGSGWDFSVSDNGIGIEPQYFDRIFIMFQRLHTRKKYPGTGIGLAMCKKIVERHGGRIWVESEPGKGSTFYFTIPVKEGDKRN